MKIEISQEPQTDVKREKWQLNTNSLNLIKFIE